MAANAVPSVFSSKQINWVLLLLRVASGLVFLYHGSAILFGAFGGPGPVAFASGMHTPATVGYLVGVAEFGGGIAVLIGIFTRVGAACIAVVMIGAILFVHLPNGFDIGKGGMEYALTQLLIALALLVTGAGDYSFGVFLPGQLRKF